MKNNSKKNEMITFRTVEEYLKFYRISTGDKTSDGSRYYHVGEAVAKMACEKAIYELHDKVTNI